MHQSYPEKTPALTGALEAWMIMIQQKTSGISCWVPKLVQALWII